MSEKKEPPFRLSDDGTIEIRRPDGSWVKCVPGADGSMAMIMEDGRKFELDGEGGGEITLPNITAIGIYNALELKAYTITRSGPRVMHHIVFYDGK